MPLQASVFNPSVQDTLITDILDRLVAIQQLIPIPDGSGNFLNAGPRFYDPVSGPFPWMYNRFANLGTDIAAPRGQPYYADTLTFEMRLIVGSLSSGYLFEREDTFNALIYRVIDTFRQRIMLDSPTDGTALRFLAPGRNASQISAIPGGFHPYTFDNAPQSQVYMGTGFLINVNVLTQAPRIS